MPELRLPLPPPELNDDGKIEWGRISEELFRLGLLTGLDRGALTALCDAWGTYMQTLRLIQELQKGSALNGLMLRTKQGNFIPHPLRGIANKQRADYVRICAEFGMTPSARASVSVPPASRPGNAFSEIG